MGERQEVKPDHVRYEPYGAIHEDWREAVPQLPCSQCGQPMTVETLTNQTCRACKRGLFHSLYCRHCGQEMDEEDCGYDRDSEASASVFTCPGCGATADTLLFEEVGPLVIDESPPALLRDAVEAK